MKPWLKWTLAGVVLALLAAGTTRTLLARKSQQAMLSAQQQDQTTEVSLNLTAAELLTVQTLELRQHIPLAGTLKAVNSAMVKARVPGELLDLTLREGDAVQKDQIVARIDATDAQARTRQAQQQVAAAQAQVDIAQRADQNNRALMAQGFISGTALQNAQATLHAAQANLAVAQAGVTLAKKTQDDTVLRAPMTGVVAQRLAQPGERVGVDARILEIIDISQLELEATLSAAESIQVRVGQTALLRVAGVAADIPAQVVRVNPSASPGSRAVLAYLRLSGNTAQNQLRQGLFAQGALATGQLRALAIPLRAVRTDKPQAYAQRVINGQVQHQTVTLGPQGSHQGQLMVSVSGLAEGDLVLDGSVGSLRAGTLVKLPAAR